MVINSGYPFHRSSRGQSVCFRDRGIIIGATARSEIMSFGEEIHAVGVRFHPGKSYPLFRVPARELSDHIVPSRDIGLQDFDALPELFAKFIRRERRIEILENLLTSRLVDSDFKEERALRSVALIKKHKGSIKIEDIAKQVEMSRRNFERRFKLHVGLSPKVFSRIVRIQMARRHMKSGCSQSLTSLAYEVGFYDQAHFVREFRAIMNLTPRQYLMEKMGGVSRLYNS